MHSLTWSLPKVKSTLLRVSGRDTHVLGRRSQSKAAGDGRVPGLILPLSVCLQLPYEKNCKNKLFCVAELQVATAISQ